MLTYKIYKTGTTFGPLTLDARVHEKEEGILHLADPPLNAADLTAEELNQLPTTQYTRFDVIYSEQDVTDNDWEWRWNGTAFVQLTGSELTETQTFLSDCKTMWQARNQWFKGAPADVVQETNWANLTTQHKKVIMGAGIPNFTEADWDALGYDDLTYLGADYNYPFSTWDKVKKFIL